MRKSLLLIIAISLYSAAMAQHREVRGYTATGIKGIQRSLASVIAYDKAHPIPENFKIHLRPELEGPRPRGQNPGSQAAAKMGNNSTAYKVTATSAPTQTVHSNFLTIWGSYAAVNGRESPYTPPDNCGDVGTTQIVATANCRMKVFAKPSVTSAAVTTPAGSSTSTLPAVLDVNLNTFFTNNALGITGVSDPHVRFDRLSGRWFIVAIEVNHNVNNYCCLAVSDGPAITPNSVFSLYYFNVSGTGGSASDFFDYPTLGIDKNALYIGGNMFLNQNGYSGSNLWVVNKASLLAGTLTVTGFSHGLTNTDMYTPQGVQNDDPAAANGYFIGASRTYYAKLNIRRVTFSGGTPTLSADLALTTLQVYSPKTVPTLNGTAIDGGDWRLYAAMIKKNKITGATSLWVAQCTRLSSQGIGGSSGDRDGALWLEIGNLGTTPSIVQSATLCDEVNAAGSAIYYTYPSIATSGQGHSVMGFTAAGPTRYSQGGVAGRYRDDPAGNFQSPVDLTTSSSSYNPGANRWGDYTQSVVDPVDDMTMWTFTQYAATTNAWGVRAAQLKAPPPSTPVLAAIPACGTTSTVTINGTSVNSSEFFDPGSDAGGPGFSHLNVIVSGSPAITVSNIVFVSPTQVQANLSVPANASGTYTLTVTNPDGQSASSTFNLNCSSPCNAPTNLNASAITINSATLAWTAAGGASSYDVDYRLAGASTWNNVVTGTSATSANVAGLSLGSNYEWRVRSNCGAGISSGYVSSTFSTPAQCSAPAGLNETVVTSSGATLNWNAVSGASTYDVEFKLSSSSTWLNAAQQTSSLSVTLTGLGAASSYDWQVRANCPQGSSIYSGDAFTTSSAGCTDNYEPNNSLATAAAIPVGTDIRALIGYSKDLDYYSFSNTSDRMKIKVTLTNLPADYDMKLYNYKNAQVAHSTNNGTKDEVMIYNSTTVGNFKVYVLGTSGKWNATQCYTLNVQLGVSNFAKNGAGADDDLISEEGDNDMVQTLRDGLKVYPVPARGYINVSFDALAKGFANIMIYNHTGQKVYTSRVPVSDGINVNRIDISRLRPGIYTVKVNNGTDVQAKKLIIYQ